MIGSFLTRGLAMVFGYAYPAYECFKTVEKNKPDIEQLRFWCQYWILVAVITICERIGDSFVSWVPMYSEAKLAFFIYLWYPKTMGTTYVYDSFFRPYIAKHEPEIDRNLLELRTKASDIAFLYWQKAASYGQTRIFEVLHYISAQSTPRPGHAQSHQQGAKVRKPTAASNHKPTAKAQSAIEEPLTSPTSNASSSRPEQEEAQDSDPTQGPTVAASTLVVSNAQKITPVQAEAEASSLPNSKETEVHQIESESMSGNENINPPAQEIVKEEASRVKRVKLRKTRSATNHKITEPTPSST
ncbi:hypothetical protein NMG60_11024436 [Bertholletia excelsa]